MKKTISYIFKKSLFAILMIIISIFTAPVKAYIENSIPIIDEIQLLGVDIPNEIKYSKNRDAILEELNEHAKRGEPGFYNYLPTQQLYNELLTAYSYKTNDIQLAAYTLVNSTVYGSWSNTFLNYNCYSYGLSNTTQWLTPGDLSGGGFSIDMSISQMADLVINDLTQMGFSAYKTTTKPTTISGSNIVLAIRKGISDFHVMKAITVNTWRHKPGNTNILTWKFTSPGYTTWTNEGSFNGVTYAPSTTYTSSIYYIVGFLQVRGSIE